MKFALDDTIAAIATPPGQGGAGIIRISGMRAQNILSKLVQIDPNSIESHRMKHGFAYNNDGGRIDEIMYCFMAGPQSYTGEDVVELFCHGNTVILNQILSAVLSLNIRLAEPGEFTKRAFLNGRIDLAQAEAVAELVSARTEKGAGLALAQLEGRLSKVTLDLKERLLSIAARLETEIDFSDDVQEAGHELIRNELAQIGNEITSMLMEGKANRIFQDGISAVIIGKPNVGKSSLLNAILKEERSIVTDIPGTTRDTIVEPINLKGMPIKFVDTAGLREPKEIIEEEGIKRTEKEIEASDLIIMVLDASKKLSNEDKEVLLKGEGRSSIIVINKIDLARGLDEKQVVDIASKTNMYKTSAIKGEGVEELLEGIFNSVVLGNKGSPLNSITINERHRECLEGAGGSINMAIKNLTTNMGVELVCLDIKEAIVRLGEISGELVADEVIDRIFENFCIGK